MRNSSGLDFIKMKKPGFAIICMLAVQLISLRVIFKYAPNPVFACLLFGTSCLICFWLILFSFKRNAFVSSKWLTFALLLILFLINLVIYPRADALKQKGMGSDADDAVIMATTRLFRGDFPYSEMTYLNHPISPGPGILFFMSPFVITGTFVLAIPFFVSLFALACYTISGSFRLTNQVLMILFSSLGFWEYMFIGSDLIVISLLIALVTGCIFKFERNNLAFIFFSLLLGILLTSRVTLIYFIPFMALILFKRSRKSSIIFSLLSLLTCIGLHAVFYYRDPSHYAPFHLIHKGRASTPIYLIVISLMCMLGTVISLINKKSISRLTALKYAWLFLAIPHFFIGLGMLISDHLKFANSEGPGYLMIQLFPFLLFYLCFTLQSETQRPVIPKGTSLLILS